MGKHPHYSEGVAAYSVGCCRLGQKMERSHRIPPLASTHLSWGDLAMDNPGQPSTLSVRLKASKTDPFRKGITLYIGKVPSNLCPVAAMLAYYIFWVWLIGCMGVLPLGRLLPSSVVVLSWGGGHASFGRIETGLPLSHYLAPISTC